MVTLLVTRLACSLHCRPKRARVPQCPPPKREIAVSLCLCRGLSLPLSVSIYIHIHTHNTHLHIDILLWIMQGCVCVYICVCVTMCVYIYIYICMYTHANALVYVSLWLRHGAPPNGTTPFGDHPPFVEWLGLSVHVEWLGGLHPRLGS